MSSGDLMRNEEGFFFLFAFKKSSAHHVRYRHDEAKTVNWFFGQQQTHSMDNNFSSFSLTHSPHPALFIIGSQLHSIYIGNVYLPLGRYHAIPMMSISMSE